MEDGWRMDGGWRMEDESLLFQVTKCSYIVNLLRGPSRYSPAETIPSLERVRPLLPLFVEAYIMTSGRNVLSENNICDV
jgi:hypothetical protein